MTHQTFSKDDLAKRLVIAMERTFPSSKAAADVLCQLTGLSPHTLRAHKRGTRVPTPETLAIYARAMNTTVERLLYGGERSGKASKFNQLTRDVETPPSHNETVRHIVVLTATQLAKNPPAVNSRLDMHSQTMPIPSEFGAAISDDAFVYQIPVDDSSMMGAKCEVQLRPNTYLIVDRTAPINPGNLALVLWEGIARPLARCFQSALPFSAGKPFRLIAANPNFADLEVASKRERKLCLATWRIRYAWTEL